MTKLGRSLVDLIHNTVEQEENMELTESIS